MIAMYIKALIKCIKAVTTLQHDTCLMSLLFNMSKKVMLLILYAANNSVSTKLKLITFQKQANVRKNDSAIKEYIWHLSYPDKLVTICFSLFSINNKTLVTHFFYREKE